MEDQASIKMRWFTQTVQSISVSLLFFFSSTQLTKHFWPDWSYIFGIKSDYLAITISFVDLLILIMLFLHGDRVVKNLSKWFGLVTTLAILFILHTTLSLQPLHTIFMLLRLTLYGLVFKIVAYRFREYRSFIIGALALGTFFQLLLVGLQVLHQSSLQGVWYWLGERTLIPSLPDIAKIYIHGAEYIRPYGTFSHPNSLGGFYLVLFFLARLWKERAREPFLYMLCAFTQIGSAVLVVASFSKTAIAVFALIHAGILFGSWKKSTQRIEIVMKTVLLFFVAFVFLSFTSDSFSLEKRDALLRNALLIIGQHPLFGTGLGNYVIAQSRLSGYHWLASVYQPVHNIFMLVLAEMGLWGVAVLYVILKKYSNVANTVWASYGPIIVSIVLTGMMDHYWITLPQNIFLLLFVLSRMAESRREIKE